MANYKTRIKEISKKLEEKTLTEIQEEMNTSRYNYTGVGFGYQLLGKKPKTRKEAIKFTETPSNDKFLKAVEAL
ncbi:MAG: hypothetical protein FWB77_02775 [Treponema sp.]|nr:hypothetical protein [Treponema sp.]